MSLAERYRGLANPERAERRLELLVLLLLALLLVQVLWGGYRVLFPSLPGPRAPSADAMQVVPVASSEDLDMQARAEIHQRPLFWASRRPLPPAVEEQLASENKAAAENTEKAGSGKIDGVKLSGVFGAGESAGIIVIAEGRKRRVMVGDSIEGWKLQVVSPTGARFSKSGREVSLALQRGRIFAAAPSAENREAPEPADSVDHPAEPPGADSAGGRPPRGGGLTLGGRPRSKN